MARGQLPKAYLRFDPNLDAHADPEAVVLMTIWANRQPRRGRFKDLVRLRQVLGAERLQQALDREDLVPQPDGSYYLDGWDDWQEGDLEVGERMRRLREKRNRSVTSDGSDTSACVTNPSPPSEASRRPGVNGTPPSPPSASADGGPVSIERRRQEVLAYWVALGGRPRREQRRQIVEFLKRGYSVEDLKASAAEHVREQLVLAGRLDASAEWPPPSKAQAQPP